MKEPKYSKEESSIVKSGKTPKSQTIIIPEEMKKFL
jgi:hypothetical protein